MAEEHTSAIVIAIERDFRPGTRTVRQRNVLDRAV
jgi:hypothetical protein